VNTVGFPDSTVRESRDWVRAAISNAGPELLTQQDKMKKCNADASAKALKGDERQAFMSTCLKADKKM
jgi:hypothetical protein